MAKEGTLKAKITEKLNQALSVQVCALKELVEAKDVAEAYVKALQEIKAICEERNRY